MKKENKPLALTLSDKKKPQWNSAAPDTADKVADQLLKVVSGPDNAALGERTRIDLDSTTEHFNSSEKKQIIVVLVAWVYTVDKQRGIVSYELNSV